MTAPPSPTGTAPASDDAFGSEGLPRRCDVRQRMILEAEGEARKTAGR